MLFNTKTFIWAASAAVLCAASGLNVAGAQEPQGNVEIREVSPEVMKELGMVDGDLLILSKEDSTVWFRSGDLQYKSGLQEKPRTLIKEITIQEFRDSPTCYLVKDSNGNSDWYPVPDCPH